MHGRKTPTGIYKRLRLSAARDTHDTRMWIPHPYFRELPGMSITHVRGGHPWAVCTPCVDGPRTPYMLQVCEHLQICMNTRAEREAVTNQACERPKDTQTHVLHIEGTHVSRHVQCTQTWPTHACDMCSGRRGEPTRVTHAHQPHTSHIAKPECNRHPWCAHVYERLGTRECGHYMRL